MRPFMASVAVIFGVDFTGPHILVVMESWTVNVDIHPPTIFDQDMSSTNTTQELTKEDAAV